jgi:hypothetical protein
MNVLHVSYSTFPPNMDTMTRCWVQRLGRGTKNKNPGQFALAGAVNGAGVFWGLAGKSTRW